MADHRTRLSGLNIYSLLVGAVITTVLGLVGTLVYDRIKALDAKLEYDLTTTPPLIGEVENNRFYTLEVRNTGEREVEDVRIGIGFGEGQIEDHEIQAPPALLFDDGVFGGGNELLIEISQFNPNDELSASTLVSYAASTVDPPTIDVRGPGVTGTSSDAATGRSGVNWLSPLIGLVATLAGAALALLVRLRD